MTHCLESTCLSPHTQTSGLCHHDTLGNATRVALLLLKARRSPASQATQLPAPWVSLYEPGGHAVQTPPLVPVYPALHPQSVALSLPAGELESAGQSRQKVGVASQHTRDQ